ncbi:MAP3K7 C-terminal-like protein isoform X4 [Dermochelys coriacea]|uniref:MAP3K7 C-terminal-like protein isoform X4 n=1 Tax=Dermochelys coriacea TaxID=27794 RepID=UPI0018E7927B|nr:MAP3K7 C-terminal-like protein isoform X4 [Dermochelys coriacea]
MVRGATLEHADKRVGSSAHMITTARVPADKPVRIAFSLNDSPDDTPPENTFPLAFPELEQQLQPLPPCHDSTESMEVFKQHCQIAEDYHEVKKEIALLEERKFWKKWGPWTWTEPSANATWNTHGCSVVRHSCNQCFNLPF